MWGIWAKTGKCPEAPLASLTFAEFGLANQYSCSSSLFFSSSTAEGAVDGGGGLESSAMPFTWLRCHTLPGFCFHNGVRQWKVADEEQVKL